MTPHTPPIRKMTRRCARATGRQSNTVQDEIMQMSRSTRTHRARLIRPVCRLRITSRGALYIYRCPHGNDAPAVPDLQSPSKHSTSLSGEGVPLGPAGGHRSFSQSGRQAAAAGNGAAARIVSEPQITEDSRAFIDQTLRERVESDITAFLAAFDAALTRDTPESRAGLREATDRLLRAGARTRIELERLEARVPLSSPNRGRQQDPAWRQHRPAR